jgi:hypothetical protein
VFQVKCEIYEEFKKSLRLKFLHLKLKTKTMKKVILLFALIFISYYQFTAQTIYTVDAEYKAKVKVFVVDAEYKADLLVYKVDAEYKAKDNRGLWYFVDAEYKAKKKIYFVDAEYKADIKVYFVDAEYKAKWNKPDKQHWLL